MVWHWQNIKIKRELISAQTTPTRQQRPESPTITLTWHASKCMVQPHQRYILTRECESNTRYINFTRGGGCTSDGVYVPSVYSHENVPLVSGLCVVFVRFWRSAN